MGDVTYPVLNWMGVESQVQQWKVLDWHDRSNVSNVRKLGFNTP